MSRARRSVLLVLFFVFGVPIGYAAAQVVAPGGSESPGKPASACPEAALAYEKAGTPIDYFIPDCPSGTEIEAVTKPGQPPDALLDQCEDLLARADNQLCSEVLREYRP